MDVHLPWLQMVNMYMNQPRDNKISRNYYETTGIVGDAFSSLGRLYDNGELVFATTQPFYTFEDMPRRQNYSRLLNAANLQTKIGQFVNFVLAFAQSRQANGVLQLRLTLKSNQPMQLRLNNPTRLIHRAIIGNHASIESDQNIEEFSWQIQINDGQDQALRKTNDRLIKDIYRAFHYSEPELFSPFDIIQ